MLARLDGRLERDTTRPLAVALSGGGDSLALLALAAHWSRHAGRPLLALTVDHGLNPDSAAWSRFCAEAAAGLGARWIGLRWGGNKPSTGLPAAARRARHALIADAARDAGARVILFGHTADDLSEADWMRGQGGSVGRPREWAPSPAWPEGRGLMAFRPLLDVRREELRHALRDQGRDWIDDPANADPRFARARARAALETSAAPVPAPETTSPPGAFAADWTGVVTLERTASPRALAAAMLSAGGGDAPPRGDRLDRLAQRLASSGPLTASLAGARIEAWGDGVRIVREAGDYRRRAVGPVPAAAGSVLVWDGRFAIESQAPGWRVAPAQGRMARLSPADRAVLGGLPAAVRPTLPVLFRDEIDAPVLAWRAARVETLVARRLSLALGSASGQMTHERQLDDAIHGAAPPDGLFSG